MAPVEFDAVLVAERVGWPGCCAVRGSNSELLLCWGIQNASINLWWEYLIPFALVTVFVSADS